MSGEYSVLGLDMGRGTTTLSYTSSGAEFVDNKLALIGCRTWDYLNEIQTTRYQTYIGVRTGPGLTTLANPGWEQALQSHKKNHQGLFRKLYSCRHQRSIIYNQKEAAQVWLGRRPRHTNSRHVWRRPVKGFQERHFTPTREARQWKCWEGLLRHLEDQAAGNYWFNHESCIFVKESLKFTWSHLSDTEHAKPASKSAKKKLKKQ